MNNEMLLGVVRHVLGFAAAWAVSKGYMRGELVEIAINSLIGIGVVGWSMADKMNKPAVGDVSVPPQSGVPLHSSSPPTAGWFGIVILGSVLALAAPAALADGPPPRQSKIWTPQELPASIAPAPISSAFYLSVLGSYAALQDEFSDGQFRAGLGIGYLAKFASLGVGVDFDATRQLSDDERKFQDELDNWNFSARARVGYFMSPTLFPFVSVGWAHIFTQDTMTYGIGVESFMTERVSLRFEATKYEINDDLLDLKLSVNFKF